MVPLSIPPVKQSETGESDHSGWTSDVGETLREHGKFLQASIHCALEGIFILDIPVDTPVFDVSKHRPTKEGRPLIASENGTLLMEETATEANNLSHEETQSGSPETLTPICADSDTINCVD